MSGVHVGDGDWLGQLNPQQRQAATHEGGPLLVIAGAGSGKTKTLACRVAWLIRQGTPPDRILLLTFTRRAAAEMLDRASRIIGQGATGRVWGGTFHSVANRLLRQYGQAVRLPLEFTVSDQADAAVLMDLIRGELGLSTARRRFPQKSTLAAIYSRSVNSRTRVSEVVKRHFPWCQDALEGITQVFQQYTERKRRSLLLDYDDLLLFWRALVTGPGVSDLLADRFDHILVDEYQDTNSIQAEIVQGMRRNRDGLMVVGDDAQSIYSFRAATVRNILEFPQQFPGTTVVKLEQNYRSTQPILDASNAVMAHAGERYAKDLFTERGGSAKPVITTCLDEGEQCAAVCDRVLAKREEGLALRDQAVLFRAGHNSDQLEVELSRRNIPFVKYGGLKFVEAAHVKDMLALLRILDNPRDELSWHRVLQLMEGIGPAGARRIVASLNAGARSEGDSEAETDAKAESESARDSTPDTPTNLDPLQRLLQDAPPVPESAYEDFAALRDALADCQSSEMTVASQVERIRRFYEPIFQRVYDNAPMRLRDLDSLEQIAVGSSSRAQFLADLALDPPSSTQDLAGPPLLDEDYLILSTIHSAKGCEWNAVHLIHVSDGIIPSDMATGSTEEIEEERRLLYVAMTRARDALYLYFPLRYYDRPRGRGDRHSYAQLTRFVPPEDWPLYEREGGHHGASIEAGAAQPAAIDGVAAVDSLLDDLWK
ncbi:MAG: ATP-dependent helicase [Actinomycetota bacterium]